MNLASLSADARPLLVRSWWVILVLGFAVPVLMLGVDQMLFAGASLTRVRELGSEPLPLRLVIVVYSGVTEELIYRVLIATLVAWLTFKFASAFVAEPKLASQWTGVLVAALAFGFAHVGNLPDIPHPVLRAVTINGIAGIVLGWLYWWRGLEAAISTHMIAIIVLYIGLPILL